MLIGVRKSVIGQKTYRPGHRSEIGYLQLSFDYFFLKLRDVLSGYRIFSRSFVKSMPILSKGST